jgi:hypothetical protein
VNGHRPRSYGFLPRQYIAKEEIVNRLSILLIVFLPLAVLPACASQPISPEAIAGTYTVTMTDDALSDAGASFMSRTFYTDKQWIMEFTTDGVHRWSEVTPLGAVERSYGDIVLTRGEILFKKDHGEMSCTERGQGLDFTEEGRYKWRLEGDQLEFELISDECEGRSINLIAQPWTRQP